MKHKSVSGSLIVLVLLSLGACSSGRIPLTMQIDTPAYHVATGNKMLELNKVDAAFREFGLAIDLAPKFSPAYVGLGLALAYRSQFDQGLKALENADRFARGKQQEVAVLYGIMRFHIIGTENVRPDWMIQVQNAFNKAILIGSDLPAPYYYMGLAYKMTGQSDQAAKKFFRVIEIGKGYVSEARREYAAIEAKEQ
jgi:tetratricopeptide (TPR) repeat protein